MEKSLSMAGVHGGKVRIFKDSKISRTIGSIPNKPSMSGAHVAALFKASKLTSKEKVWMDICKVENQSSPTTKLIRMHMWKAYEDLQPYLKGLALSPTQKTDFKILVHKWAKLYIQAFGEEHMTHYMVQPYSKPLNAKNNLDCGS